MVKRGFFEVKNFTPTKFSVSPAFSRPRAGAHASRRRLPPAPRAPPLGAAAGAQVRARDSCARSAPPRPSGAVQTPWSARRAQPLQRRPPPPPRPGSEASLRGGGGGGGEGARRTPPRRR